jgi:hypothetical protein
MKIDGGLLLVFIMVLALIPGAHGEDYVTPESGGYQLHITIDYQPGGHIAVFKAWYEDLDPIGHKWEKITNQVNSWFENYVLIPTALAPTYEDMIEHKIGGPGGIYYYNEFGKLVAAGHSNQCEEGLTSCQATCVDTLTDPNNCGSCKNTCDDGDACTIDTCEGGGCVYTPIVCDDNDACTEDACVGNGECENTPMVCGDGETCIDGVCEAYPTCDDGIQNGDETDVDCGGSVCPACPTDQCVADNCDNSNVNLCDASCGGPFGDGHCFTTTEGSGACLADYYCGSGPTCTSSADCPDGVCITGDCCGYNECRPVSDFCSTDRVSMVMSAEMSTTPHDGPTGASLGPQENEVNSEGE